jgi:uncharacterized protein YegL
MQQNYNKNNRSRAHLGHGKWKHALGCALLLIGFLMGFGMMNAFAQEATGGLYMHKTWVPTSTNGDKGYIQLETFVTGETTVVNVSVPTDIVVVVDQSGSMKDAFDGTENVPYEQQRIYALKQALTTFVNTVQTDAATKNCDHKIAIVGFGSSGTGYNRVAYENTELLSTLDTVNYADINSPDDYQDALVPVNLNNDVNPRLSTAINRIAAQGGTFMQYGMEMAYNILDKRIETTFVDENHQTHDRAQVVVFFTDGYPGGNQAANQFREGAVFEREWDWGYTYYRTAYYTCKTVADAAVNYASQIKNKGATVFSVGIYTGADPNAAFTTRKQTYSGTNYGNGQYYYIQGGQWTGPVTGSRNSTYDYWTDGNAAANGLLHFISSDYDKNTDSWSANTTSSQNTANKFENSKFMSASNASQLSQVFSQIAAQSGGAEIEMGTNTVVQDVISADFTFDIPSGSTIGATVKAYLPLCVGAVDEHNTPTQWEEDETNLLFADLSEGELTVNADGSVIGGTGHENKLPEGKVRFEGEHNKTLKLTGINFDNLWCGREEYEDQGQTKVRPHGRKLVIIIPLVIDGNTWGDGIETNGPMSVVLPNGDVLHPIEFNMPTADVVGEVWTEVVTSQPETFNPNVDPIPLTTPEDLAWFISWVNGRKGYIVNSNVTPHPTANAILMADIDMSAHNWVPIGINTIAKEGSPSEVVSYQGTFDGNGHVITGLKNNAGKKYMESKVSWVFPGMFNKVGGKDSSGNGIGTVKNVFVLDADFRGQQRTISNKECFVHHGIIADTLLAGGTIFNCEAAGRLTCNNKNPETDVNLIFGGLVGLNQGTVHSCMAMAELTGYTMGGMIGENGKGNDNGSFTNGFTNGVYHYLGKNGDGAENKPVGGIAGINKSGSTISNCYVRFSRDTNSNLEKTNSFGRIVGDGSFTTTSCYSPMFAIMSNDGTMGADPGNVPMEGHGIQYSTTCAPSLMREAHSNDNMVSDASDWPTWTSITYDNGTIVPLLQGGTPLLDQLNAGVPTGSDQATWKRTTAGGYATSLNGGNINGDYPILQFNAYKCVASADGIRLDYAATLDEMLDRHNAGNMNVGTNMPSTDDWYTTPDKPVTTYAVSQSPAIYGGAINLYANDNTTRSTSTTAKTMVYIDENVSLLQGNTTSRLDAYTGQTLKSFSTSWPGGSGGNDGQRWHNVSSSLSNSKFGWEYHVTGQVEHNWEPNPCDWFLNVNNDDEAIFPSDARSTAVADFYCFFEPEYHWINFRRNGKSHWHMDNYTTPIDYCYTLNGEHHSNEDGNETQFIPGKGYLMALSTEYFEDHYLAAAGNKHEQFIQNRGTLNNGPVNIPVTYTAANEWTGLAGYNLLGNPYQSYLDFDEFVDGNKKDEENSIPGLWADGDTYAQTYAVYNPQSDSYEQYKSESSKGSRAAGKYINMHQGFFIKTSLSGTAHFTNAMRSNDGTPCFRGEQPAYPLINFELSDGSNSKDVAVLEVGRPENDGAEKLRVKTSSGRIYLRYDNRDCAILFRDMTEGCQPLWFETDEDGTFTLSWNTANANFRELTLVDNITGVKYDMLRNDSYEFEGRASDYKSRFKVVIGGINAEDEPEVETNQFAFFNGSEWVINGQGQLMVTDVMGRVVYNDKLVNDQNHVSLNGLSQGVYLMQVSNGSEAMVQKIVVR